MTQTYEVYADVRIMIPVTAINMQQAETEYRIELDKAVKLVDGKLLQGAKTYMIMNDGKEYRYSHTNKCFMQVI